MITSAQHVDAHGNGREVRYDAYSSLSSRIYCPLDNARSEIRIVKLLPVYNPGDDIHCQLHTVDRKASNLN